MRKIVALLFIVTLAVTTGCQAHESDVGKQTNDSGFHYVKSTTASQLVVNENTICPEAIGFDSYKWPAVNFSPALHQQTAFIDFKSTYGTPAYIRHAPREGSYYYLLGVYTDSATGNSYRCSC